MDRNPIIEQLDSHIIEMVKLSGLRSSLQRGLSCFTSTVYQDRKPELGSGIDGFNERLSGLEAMAAEQAFMVASGQKESVDHLTQGRIWKGLAQSFESYGVHDRDGSTPNIVGAYKWRISQDATESSADEAEAIAKAGRIKMETVKKMRDRSVLARYQHRAQIGEDACTRYLHADPIFDAEPVGWEEVWDRIKTSAEADRIRTVRDADELINDLFLLADA